jgi:hypothetical protein
MLVLFHAGHDALHGGADAGILLRSGRHFVGKGREDQAARIDSCG